MKELNFRKLTADEIECRVGVARKNGCSLLLYKTSRVDRDLLDEAVGKMNWQIHQKEIKGILYAGISIWDEDKKQWIEKWSAGVESNTEEQKGEDSDAMKRSGFRWGIGVELYSAPFIWIPSSKYESTERNGKFYPDANFKVTNISYDAKGRINGLKIVNTKLKGEDGKLLPESEQVVFTFLTKELIEQIKTSKSKKQQIVEALQES